MGTTLQKQSDIWKKAQVIAEILIAIIGLLFTIIFGLSQQKSNDATMRNTEANIKISESQYNASKIQSITALLPFLINKESKQRETALYLSKLLDTSLTISIAGILAKNDPDEKVRKLALTNLQIFSNSPQTEVQHEAKKMLDQYEIFTELSTKGLLKKISAAQNYVALGNPSDKEKALQIYREIIDNLSVSALNKLDSKLFKEANDNFKKSYFDDAILKYQALFSDYIN